MDLNSISEQFEEIIEYSQKLDITIHADDLFDQFIKAKKYFINKFGGLIYEYPEKVSLPIHEQENPVFVMDRLSTDIDDYLQNAGLEPYTNIEVCLAELWLCVNKDGFLSNKMVKSIDTTIVQQFLNSLNVDEEKRNLAYQIWQNKCASIPENTKLLKSLKYFITDKKVLRIIQDLCSKEIQATHMITGTLCLSVHPLDFLSLSENAHNWRSCHALDGDYRAGNVSYMLDESTFICYIKADGEYNLPDFPDDILWNSKKLRRLFFLSNDKNMMFAGRSYPFDCDSLLDFVKENIFNKMFRPDYYYYTDSNKPMWSEWSDEQIDSYTNNAGNKIMLAENYFDVGGYLRAAKDLIVDSKSALHYDDLLYSSCYKPKFSVLKKQWVQGIFSNTVNKQTKFYIGHDCNCLHCNKKPIFDSATFLCKQCEIDYGNSCNDIMAYCPICDRRFVEEEGEYNYRVDSLICPDCFEEYGSEGEDYGDEE